MDVTGRATARAARPARMLALLVTVALLVGVVVVVAGALRAGAQPPVLASAPSSVAAGPPQGRRPLLPPLAADALEPTAAGLLAALSAGLDDPRLGGRPAVAVVDAESGELLLSERGGDLLVPASTSKIVTATAALTVLDPLSRPVTRVLAGATPGQVVLVGGGDATLVGRSLVAGGQDPPDLAPTESSGAAYPQRADLTGLAAAVRTALGGVPVQTVLVDDTLYEGPVLGPGWKPGYVTDGNVAPVTALMIDGGRLPGRTARSLDPPVAAGVLFAELLGSPGASVTRGTAPPGARVLATVSGPTVAQQVELMLTESDNDLAESLARQVALARGGAATFTGAAQAVREVVAEVLPGPSASGRAPSAPGGAGTASLAVRDGSGLSRNSRLSPETLARLLALVARQDDDRYGPLLSGLPVAGFDGTLQRRYDGPAASAAGVVRGKTGTLSGTSALAGLLRTADGRLLAFDLTADAVPPGANRAAEVALDTLAARLVGCGCR